MDSQAEVEGSLSNNSFQRSNLKDDKCNWISLDWLQRWVKGDIETAEAKEIDNSLLVCAHNKLGLEKVENMKCISRDGWKFLHEKYGGGPELDQNSYCQTCVHTAAEGTAYC